MIPSDSSDLSDPSHPAALVRAATPEAAANTLICLIHQASYLLGRQIARLERDFTDHGGFTERLYAARKRTLSEGTAIWTNPSDSSDKSDKSDRSDAGTSPACPLCGKPMRQRTARQGARAGSRFWGCSAYPDCKGIRMVS